MPRSDLNPQKSCTILRPLKDALPAELQRGGKKINTRNMRPKRLHEIRRLKPEGCGFESTDRQDFFFFEICHLLSAQKASSVVRSILTKFVTCELVNIGN